MTAVSLYEHPVQPGSMMLTPRLGRVFVELDARDKSEGGVWYPDDYVPPATEGWVRGYGQTDLRLEYGMRVALQPASGVLLSECNPLKYPPGVVECDEGDIIATEPRGVWSIVRDDAIPWHSVSRLWDPIADHVFMRPYSPASVHAGGIITVKNDKYPRIWAWIHAIDWATLSKYPDLVPGRMVVYARFADELLGYDRRDNGNADLAVTVCPVEEIKAVLWDPVPVTQEFV